MQEACGKITKLWNIDGKMANEQGFFFRINGQNCKIMSYKGKENEVIIPDAINGKPVRAIGKRVFAKKDIVSVVLPTGLKKIGEEAFYQSKLKKVELPETIEKIEKNAFGECEELTVVTLKEHKNEINVDWYSFAKTPFADKPNLVILGDILLRINDINEGEDVLKIPNGIKVVGKDASDNGTFRNPAEDKIKKIQIPPSVRKIEDRAFQKLYWCNVVEKDNQGPLYLGRDVFGKADSTNCFIRKLAKTELGITSSYWQRGTREMKRLVLVYPRYDELYEYYTQTYLQACTIYIPLSNKEKEAFWDCMQVKYIYGKGFCFYLKLEEYYKLMIQVKSLREQLQMAKFLVSKFHGKWREKIVLFFQQHIHKAVKYAVEENDVEQLKMYVHLQLLKKEKGFRIRQGKYLTEKYQNGAARYLKQQLV